MEAKGLHITKVCDWNNITFICKFVILLSKLDMPCSVLRYLYRSVVQNFLLNNLKIELIRELVFVMSMLNVKMLISFVKKHL